MSEIEIVVAPAPWIDERGEPRALDPWLTVVVYRCTRKRDGTLGLRARLALDDGDVAELSAEDRRLIDLLLGCTPRFDEPRRSPPFREGSSFDEADDRCYLIAATIADLELLFS